MIFFHPLATCTLTAGFFLFFFCIAYSRELVSNNPPFFFSCHHFLFSLLPVHDFFSSPFFVVVVVVAHFCLFVNACAVSVLGFGAKVLFTHVAAIQCFPPRCIFQSSGAVWKSRWPSVLTVLMSLTVSVDVKQHWTVLRHWSQFVPNMSTDIRRHEPLLHHHQFYFFPWSVPIP